jgi:LytS/YehU family sensor histidine kinase
LLRQSLDPSTPYEVPLHQELAFLERYLDIERARFGDRLTVDFDVPDPLRELAVPSLILQPIVENAIRHGIEPRAQAGHILLRARRQDTQLLLTVTDNGPGIEPGSPSPSSEGIGLSNTRSRLRQLYGQSQNLDLVNVPAGGLEVRLTLPCRTTQDPLPSSPPTPTVVSRTPAPSPA